MNDEPLTEEQLAACATALLLHPLGFRAKPEDLPTCASLVERGSLERFSSDEGIAFRASRQLLAAMEADARRN
jgi:hypothetical protein